MEEIVRRLQNSRKSVVSALKESMLLEKEEDEKDEENTMSNEEEEDSSEDGEDIVSRMNRRASEEGESADSDEEIPMTDEEEEEPSDESGDPVYPNPLDNPYAVHYTIGDIIRIVYATGSDSSLVGTIDGYDTEGFYRIKWESGITTNGITDSAINELVKSVQDTNEGVCVCRSREFVMEEHKLVCDNCGRIIREFKKLNNSDLNSLIREAIKGDSSAIKELKGLGYKVNPIVNPLKSIEVGTYTVFNPRTKKTLTHEDVFGYHNKIKDPAQYIQESSDPLSKADKSRPKGKRMIRSEAHPMNTHVPSSIGETIKKAFSRARINEESEEDENVFSSLSSLDNEFWTRLEDIVSDIEDLGYEVEEANNEYILIGKTDDDDVDHQLYVPIGGTSRTLVLELDKTREEIIR